jgi:hypothetical protein
LWETNLLFPTHPTIHVISKEKLKSRKRTVKESARSLQKCEPPDAIHVNTCVIALPNLMRVKIRTFVEGFHRKPIWNKYISKSLSAGLESAVHHFVGVGVERKDPTRLRQSS